MAKAARPINESNRSLSQYLEEIGQFEPLHPSREVELAQAIKELMNKNNHPIDIIGTRHGEKLYETLMSKEELACAEDLGNYFRIPVDKRDLNYKKYVEQGDSKITESTVDYNSHNTYRLNLEEMKDLLLKIGLFT